MDVLIVGGGLAGCEAAWQAARQGCRVTLVEMRPSATTPAHKTPYLAELVCSNSLKALSLDSASGLLKGEMGLLGSLLLEVAWECRVPAGGALAVDRELFARRVTERLEAHSLIRLEREEVREIPSHRPLVVATGPLTAPAFSQSLSRLFGEGYLYFYDAISPIVLGDSIDYEKAFFASRYGKGGDEDYLNCPLTEEEYDKFYEALVVAEKVPLREFEDPRFFSGCMPVEELAYQGRETLLYGPMKPVGLRDPGTGKRPFAVVQLRRENREGTLWNLVGFQTRLKWPEQRRVFRLIPALEEAEFARFGSIHRNTYINSPRLLEPSLAFKGDMELFFAGQITGVEGYMESAASGILVGINAARVVRGEEPVVPPATTMLGALVRYITSADPEDFQPMNANFGLLPSLTSPPKRKKERKMAYSERAVKDLVSWMEEVGLVPCLRSRVVGELESLVGER
ncbi:MAG TPA: FADH(2)-oxidizing methylenetetrahydrofolate--tRNA-(uracil(54)-C(5))-methyltransferase TrmFO [Thermosulfidibacter takaii]|uniref:Methylenetetrahydrofolate--tRNA-(uracil-5-)-methyltransferase TrmFO n=1 Tax=Thermosulfidibacter takaii TaxID=412593 RepID=A0A7C0YAN7_9BACT|nr:FADH(2)-oxidizing methylenetetrahydrofolate--tRNA-(uracil(54)-C(5))-methyltransferase TrmFO [Thermosulfidibacter takaii]